jgi:hypothetical protein
MNLLFKKRKTSVILTVETASFHDKPLQSRLGSTYRTLVIIMWAVWALFAYVGPRDILCRLNIHKISIKDRSGYYMG